MKVLFVSGREPTYTRNVVILKGIKENGVEVIECTSLLGSYLSRYPNVLAKFLLKHDYDLVFVGFFGQPLVPIIKKISNKPIIFDAFLSAYDTMCFDRKRFGPNSHGGKFFYWLDKHSCELADKVLLDTNAHIDYFVNTFELNRKKFQRVFVGADDSIFYLRVRDVKKEDSTFRVFYYGTHRPLQGIEYIIRAAKKLESYKDIDFEIVGKGPEHEKIMKFVQELDVRNITVIDWIPYEKLPLEIADADICLGGHFSSIDKAKRTIAGKTFQFIAMKKPVIIGDSPANRELFEDKKNALFVEHANPDALADAILELKDDESLREKIAEGGHKTFKERCTPKIIGKEIKEIMEEVLEKRG
ncbi:hypothetical protein ES705_19581 [subsurface metagenome]